MKKSIAITAVLALGMVAAQAQTLFNTVDGDIYVGGNWSNGVPTLSSQGTLNIDAHWSNAAGQHMDGWDLVQTGGTLTDLAGGYARNEIRGGSIYDIQGGTYVRTNATYSNAVRLHGGATLKVSGGSAIVSGIAATAGQAGGFTLDVSAGSFWSAKQINFNNNEHAGIINVSGGTATFGNADTRVIDEANIFFNVSGGVLTLDSLSYANAADATNIVVTVSNDGSLVTTSFGGGATDQADRYIDFAADADASWTSADLDAAGFEALWDEGTIRHNGLKKGDAGAGTFAQNFSVSGNTITAIPEPATLGMIAVFGGGILLIRRKLMM